MDTKDEIEFQQAINRTEERYKRKISMAISFIEKGLEVTNRGLEYLKEAVK